MSQIRGSRPQPQPADPGPDGPGADQRYLAARLPNPLHLVGQGLQPGRIECSVCGGENIRSHFHHQGVGQGHNFLANRIDHENVTQKPVVFAGRGSKGDGPNPTLAGASGYHPKVKPI